MATFGSSAVVPLRQNPKLPSIPNNGQNTRVWGRGDTSHLSAVHQASNTLRVVEEYATAAFGLSLMFFMRPASVRTFQTKDEMVWIYNRVFGGLNTAEHLKTETPRVGSCLAFQDLASIITHVYHVSELS